MGNNNTKYDAPDGDDSSFSSVWPYDTLSRIRINYVEISDFNGFTVNIPSKDNKTKDSIICKISEFKQLLEVYARKYVTIFKDILDLNNGNEDRNNNTVIQNIIFNEHIDYNEYQVIFSSRIRQIDINWHEKMYTALIKYPLVCDSEKITINTNIHTPSKIEKQLTQLYSGMVKICGAGINRNSNPFEESLEIKVRRNSRLTTQIINNTIHLRKHLQHLKIMKIQKVNQSNINDDNLDSVKNTTNKNIQNVEDAISQCNVMIDQLKQNITKMDKHNENVLENVFLEEVKDKCERIEKITQGKFNQINATIGDIERQAQRIIEYDWKEYNINIFKQWEIKMTQYLNSDAVLSSKRSQRSIYSSQGTEYGNIPRGNNNNNNNSKHLSSIMHNSGGNGSIHDSSNGNNNNHSGGENNLFKAGGCDLLSKHRLIGFNLSNDET